VSDQDTIVAIATPPGRGGIGIIRISGGDLVLDIARAILTKLPTPRYADYLAFYDQDHSLMDTGIALYFPAPHSFTGEHVLELQGHGGPVVLDLILQQALNLGARMARPGEFSLRAYLNNKLDLAQAEAIADLINSSTAVAARSAVRSMSGEFSQRINKLLEQLIYLRMYIEAAIDFPEEEVDFLADKKIVQQTQTLLDDIGQLTQSMRQGYLLNEGMTVVLLGRPNAGKSSLLNQLAGKDAAIVTPIAGTTRDALHEDILIDGMPLHVVDTAGLRDHVDVVEQEGIKRAWQQAAQADRVLWLIDDTQIDNTNNDVAFTDTLLNPLPAHIPITLIRNKADLSGRAIGKSEEQGQPCVTLCAKTGLGIDALKQHLLATMGFSAETDNPIIARRRHLDAISRAKTAIEVGLEQLLNHRAGELMAEELRVAQNALNEITGDFDNEALLSRIFSSFCIGK